MTRHKSRVARRSRRSARRGTRKQSGGMFDWVKEYLFKKTAPAAVPGTANAPATVVAEDKAAAQPNKGLLEIFNKDSNPVVSDANNSSSSSSSSSPQVGGRKKSRKIRHRRRRSPRHHRK